MKTKCNYCHEKIEYTQDEIVEYPNCQKVSCENCGQDTVLKDE